MAPANQVVAMSKKLTNPNPARHNYTPNIVNKKAHHDYHFLEKLEAGMLLVGTEVKSLRDGKANLEEAYCRIREGELFLYEHGNLNNHAPQRTRKLLVHRRQIKQLQSKLVQKGLTLLPHRIYFSRGLAKVEIVLARGKSRYDKREKLRDRDMTREINTALRRRR